MECSTSNHSMNHSDRYARQTMLQNVQLCGQRALEGSKVLVVGLGGLGAPVVMYLASAGVGTIGIVDYDTVELHNLQRQVIYSESDIGKLKTECTGRFISNLNAVVKVAAHNIRLERPEDVLEIVRGYEIVADCCDNVHLRYLLNDACRVQKKDLVSASALRWEGQICVARRDGACYRCMFPDMKTTAPSCATSGVMGSVCGTIGGLQASEIIKLIVARPPRSETGSNPGKFIVFNALLDLFTPFYKNFKICEVCKTGKMGSRISELAHVLRWEDIMKQPMQYDIIDTRSAPDFNAYNVPGSINMPNVEEELERIKGFYRPVVVTCYKGVSSKEQAALLRKNGVTAYSADSGIEGYRWYIRGGGSMGNQTNNGWNNNNNANNNGF